MKEMEVVDAVEVNENVAASSARTISFIKV